MMWQGGVQRALPWLALGAALSSGELAAQSLIAIGEKPVCPRCTIELRKVVTLVGTPEVALSYYSRVAVQSNAYVVGPTFSEGQLLVFDKAGNAVTTFGRQGQGPGEFSGSSLQVLVGPGDSVHVLAGGKWVVLSPEYTYVRSTVLPGDPVYADVTSDGYLLASILPHGPSAAPDPIRLIAPQSGKTIRALPTRHYAEDGEMDWMRGVSASGETVWSHHVNRYEIRSYSLADSSQRVWKHDGGWFSAWAGTRPATRALPHLVGVQCVDSLLFVYAAVGDTRWRPPAPVRGQERRRIPGAEDLGRMFDGVIEVVNRHTGAVLAHIRLPLPYKPVSGTRNLVETTRALEDGEIVLEIFEVSVAGG
jgi:hypothetical protein